MSRRSDYRRPAYFAFSLLAGLFLSAPMAAQTCLPASTQNLDIKSSDWGTILAKRGIDAQKDDLAVLVFEHPSSSWFVYHYSHGKELVAQTDRFGPDGNPLVLRSGSEKLLILVTRTNPFLYAYEGVVLPPQDSPDAASLRTLAGAIGSAASAIVKAVPPRAGFSLYQSALENALQALENLQLSLLLADRIRQDVRTFVQAFEFDPASKPPSGLDPDVIHQGEREVLIWLADLRAARPGLNPKGLPAACFQAWAGLLSLLELDDAGGDAFKKAVEDLYKWSATAPTGCCRTVNDKRAVLDDLVKATGVDRTKKIKELRADADFAEIRTVLAIDQALAAEKDVIASLASANAFARIAEDYLGTPYAVLPRTCTAVLSPPFPPQTWLKDNPGTLSINAEGAVCADCVRLKPTVANKKYLLASRRQNVLGIGFGLVYTTIMDPTFGAVKGTDTTQVIARTSEDSRSGAIAVFGSFRLMSAFAANRQPTWWEPCLDLGAAVDVKKPSLFLGVSLEILRYARLGFGQTWQVITRLDDGQTEAQFDGNGIHIPGTGTTVSSAADIRTRNTVTSRPYFSLTFAVDALPFFQPK